MSGNRNGRLLSALLIVLSLTSCRPVEPVRLGFVGGLSGRVADLGEAGRNGFQMAVEEANAGGGIDGRRIEMLIRDDAQDVMQAETVAAELGAAGVAAIIGPMTSAMAAPVLAAATRAGIPVVSPTVTTAELTGKDDHFLRVISDTVTYSGLSAAYHFQRNNTRRVAVLFDLRNRAYTESWLGGFRTAFTGLGGAIVTAVGFESGEATDYAALVQKALGAHPDAILVVANAVDTARFAQAARQSGNAKLSLIGVEWAATERVIEFGGKAVDGMFFTQFFDRDNQSATYAAFRKTYAYRFGTQPGFASVAAYDATRAVIDAIRRNTGKPLRQALLESGPYAGAQQQFGFDRYGDAARKAFVTVVRDGRFVVIE